MDTATSGLSYTPPDGGWGWVVVFGAFISIGFSYAFPKALTIYFREIQEYFSVSYSEIAWVSSIMLAVMYAGGPVSSVLVNRYGSRPVVMAGGIMCGVAMVTASFGSTIMHLYLCVGVIGGALVDIFHDYRYMYLLCGAVQVTAGLFLFIMNYYNYRLVEREQQDERQVECQVECQVERQVEPTEEGTEMFTTAATA